MHAILLLLIAVTEHSEQNKSLEQTIDSLTAQLHEQQLRNEKQHQQINQLNSQFDNLEEKYQTDVNAKFAMFDDFDTLRSNLVTCRYFKALSKSLLEDFAKEDS